MDQGPAGYLSVSGLGALTLGLGLYLWSIKEEGKANAISKARVLNTLQEARHMDKLMPLLVVVRGIVGSNNPKQCELCDSKAVIHELLEEEIMMRQHASGNTTREPMEVRREHTETEWFLHDDTSRAIVKVEGGRAAEGLEDALHIKQKYEEASDKLGFFQWRAHLLGVLRQGTRKTERFLPVNSTVTVIGELARSNVTLGFQQPTGGGSSGGKDAGPAVLPCVVRQPVQGPFYITPLTYSQLHARLQSSAKWLRLAAATFGAVGALLLAHKALRGLWRRYREVKFRKELTRKREQRLQQLATTPSGADVAVDGDAAGPGFDRQVGMCVVCLERRADSVFVPCGHLCCCEACSRRVPAGCPVCRQKGQVLRVYTT